MSPVMIALVVIVLIQAAFNFYLLNRIDQADLAAKSQRDDYGKTSQNIFDSLKGIATATKDSFKLLGEKHDGLQAILHEFCGVQKRHNQEQMDTCQQEAVKRGIREENLRDEILTEVKRLIAEQAPAPAATGLPSLEQLGDWAKQAEKLGPLADLLRKGPLSEVLGKVLSNGTNGKA
jgi:hypothetical protein